MLSINVLVGLVLLELTSSGDGRSIRSSSAICLPPWSSEGLPSEPDLSLCAACDFAQCPCLLLLAERKPVAGVVLEESFDAVELLLRGLCELGSLGSQLL